MIFIVCASPDFHPSESGENRPAALPGQNRNEAAQATETKWKLTGLDALPVQILEDLSNDFGDLIFVGKVLRPALFCQESVELVFQRRKILLLQG